MSRLWGKGRARSLTRNPVPDTWADRLLRRERSAGSRGRWRVGDYILLDIDSTGCVGRNCPVHDREVALVRTYRYRWPDHRQTNGQQLKRWCDYLVLRQVRRRGRGPGWRILHGAWSLFGESGGVQRFEWRAEYGGQKWYVHRFVVHAQFGAPLQSEWWRSEHLAGTNENISDPEAGWCLGTWDGLTIQRWDVANCRWQRISHRRKQRALGRLRRYRRGEMWL